jgi:hypothetical protein
MRRGIMQSMVGRATRHLLVRLRQAAVREAKGRHEAARSQLEGAERALAAAEVAQGRAAERLTRMAPPPTTETAGRRAARDRWSARGRLELSATGERCREQARQLERAERALDAAREELARALHGRAAAERELEAAVVADRKLRVRREQRAAEEQGAHRRGR